MQPPRPTRSEGSKPSAQTSAATRGGTPPGGVAGWPVNRARALTTDAFVGGPPDVRGTFRKQFGALATDKNTFHATMRAVFGEGYDTAGAEKYRQRALGGDFGWLPPVRWVGPDVLGNANGAYDAESGTVLLNRALDPSVAASTFVEEAGHHLDARLNAKDTPGDEGELFRRVLAGEKLSSAQVTEIRTENDKGLVVVDGKMKEVEFWNPLKALGKAAKSVGKALKQVGQRVADSVRGLATGVASAITGAARNIGEGAGTFLSGFGKLFQGRIGEGLGKMGKGLLKVFVQTPVDAGLMILGRAASAVQTLVGLEPPGRKLDSSQIATLKKIFGDSVDYSAVRIKEGGIGVFGVTKRPFTHGDTIYIPRNMSPLTEETLVHEMAHVWQHQNGGTDYMSEALWAQNVGDGYDLLKGLQQGKSWRELNPEQQATLLEEAFKAGFFDGSGRPFKYGDGNEDYTDYLKAALAQVRKGRGAP
jgi:hypothetical protein